jgi:hypothetical protein
VGRTAAVLAPALALSLVAPCSRSLMWTYLAAGIAILVLINLVVVIVLGSVRRHHPERDDESH